VSGGGTAIATIDAYREPGSELFFEYHCWESHDSQDAQLWYRSHQRVTVLECVNADWFGGMSFFARCEAATPLVYRIRFADGFENEAFEDELLDSEEEYQRPAPPEPRPAGEPSTA